MSVALQTLIMFLLQIAYVGLRTVNIQHIASGNILKALISGNLLGGLFLVTTGLGVLALNNIFQDWPVLAAYFIGGSIGQVIGMKIDSPK